jgi:rare lipoprotein A
MEKLLFFAHSFQKPNPMKKFLAFIIFTIGFTGLVAAQEYGLASYYSDKFQGRPTASGELYDKDKMTAAHKTHPYGTYIRVTRLDTKKSVVVRVNDRGPYISGRVVDVSRKAAEQLGLVADGTARVKLEVVSKPTDEATVQAPPTASAEPKPQDKPVTAAPKEEKPKVETPKPQDKPAVAEEKVTPEITAPVLSNTGVANGTLPMATLKDYQAYDLYKVELFKPEKAGFAVQIASLTHYDNAMRQIADLQGKAVKDILLSIEPGPAGSSMYKILIGPFPDRGKAEATQKNLKKRFKMNGFIVDLSTVKY